MSAPRPLTEFDLPLDELRRYLPERREPDDFDEFWERTLASSERPPVLDLSPAGPELIALEAFDAVFGGFAGDRIRGWLVRDPAQSGPRPCVVQFMGYSAGRGSVYDHLAWAGMGYVHLVVETRGQGGPWSPGSTPDPHPAEPHPPGRMTKGLLSPDTYIYRRVITDAVRAVRAAARHPEVDPDRIAVIGASQGGWIALAAGALADVAAVVADVPFGSHFERAVRLSDTGPYTEIANYLRLYRSAVEPAMRTLAYFDAINFAARATAPALFGVGLMDRLCPPSTVFAAHNHYAGPRDIEVWPFNGHESGGEQQFQATVGFLRRILGPGAGAGSR